MSAAMSRAWKRSAIITFVLFALVIFLFHSFGGDARTHAAKAAEWAHDRWNQVIPNPQASSVPKPDSVPQHEPSPSTSHSSTGHSNATDPCFNTSSLEQKPKDAKGTLVLITGGAGFIGSNLADRLVSLGYRVRILDNLYTGFIRNVPLQNKDIEFIHGDILDPEVLKRAVKDVEFVYHLAAMSKVLPSVRDPEMARFCTENNALGTWNVLNATREQAVVKKVVYAGSSTYYGNRPIPHNEDNAPDFLTPYAASKYEGEMQMQMFDNLFHVPTITTRFFMVYGPRQPTTGAYAIVTGVFARQASQGKPLTIEGDGTHFRDFIHVSDIVTGLVLAQQLTEAKGGIPINLGSGEYFSVKDVADMISDNQVNVAERKNDLVGTLADTCRMKKMLGYKTTADFRKEMSYMAQETMKGNVFAQPWVTPFHAFSAPHIVPVGSPMLPWADLHNDLDALLEKIEKIKETITEFQATESDRLLSIIPFGDSSEDLDNQILLLLNTIYTLVRFGTTKRYIIATLSSKHLEICQDYNLPCFESSPSNIPALAKSIVDGKYGHYDLHMSPLGTVFTSPISAVAISNAPLTHIMPNGGFIAQGSAPSTPKTDLPPRHASTAEDKTIASIIKELSLTAKPSDVESLCLSSTSSSSKICPKTAAYTLACEDKAAWGYPGGYAGMIASLKSVGLWQLSDCTNGKYCEKQQNVPMRWLAAERDLSTGPRKLC